MKQVSIAFHVDPSVVAHLDDLASSAGVSRAFVAKRLLSYALEQFEGDRGAVFRLNPAPKERT